MGIPTGGGNGSQTFESSANYTEDITIIGDGENLVGYNTDGETDVLNRSAKQLANNCNLLYNDHIRSSTAVSTSVTKSLYTLLSEIEGKVINYDYQITLHTNQFLGNTIEVKNICGAGTLTIDFGGYQFTTITGGQPYGIKFSNCNMSKIILKNGTIDDGAGGNLTDIVGFEDCPGIIQINDFTTKHKALGAGVNHYYFNRCGKVIIYDNTAEYGTNGIQASRFTHVLSYSNGVVLATDPTGYGMIADNGAVITKGDSGQFTGSTADENTATGGIIR